MQLPSLTTMGLSDLQSCICKTNDPSISIPLSLSDPQSSTLRELILLEVSSIDPDSSPLMLQIPSRSSVDLTALNVPDSVTLTNDSERPFNWQFASSRVPPAIFSRT